MEEITATWIRYLEYYDSLSVRGKKALQFGPIGELLTRRPYGNNALKIMLREMWNLQGFPSRRN